MYFRNRDCITVTKFWGNINFNITLPELTDYRKSAIRRLVWTAKRSNGYLFRHWLLVIAGHLYSFLLLFFNFRAFSILNCFCPFVQSRIFLTQFVFVIAGQKGCCSSNFFSSITTHSAVSARHQQPPAYTR